MTEPAISDAVNCLDACNAHDSLNDPEHCVDDAECERCGSSAPECEYDDGKTSREIDEQDAFIVALSNPCDRPGKPHFSDLSLDPAFVGAVSWFHPNRFFPIPLQNSFT
jgi:hypothetical protein